MTNSNSSFSPINWAVAENVCIHRHTATVKEVNVSAAAEGPPALQRQQAGQGPVVQSTPPFNTSSPVVVHIEAGEEQVGSEAR